MKKLKYLLWILICINLTGCCLSHDWQEATCTQPKTCSKCDKTEGEALGHKWIEATCTAPQTCNVCGATTGEKLGHTPTPGEWIVDRAATCDEEGSRHGVCGVCGETVTASIPATGHQWGDWITDKGETCSEDGSKHRSCGVCKKWETKTLYSNNTKHVPGEVKIVKEATLTEEGEKVQICSACGEEIKTIKYELSEEEKAAQMEEYRIAAEEREREYKAGCGYYTYAEISGNSMDYFGETAVFTGSVFQITDDGSVLLNVGSGNLIWVYDGSGDISLSGVTDGAVMTVYGMINGSKSYTTVMGYEATVPSILAMYIDL